MLPATADQLQYRPVNPNFGGSPLNGSFLMQQATVQNHFKDNNGSGASAWAPPTASEQLQQTLTNALMGQLTAKVADQLFGQNALPAGTWQIGGNTVTVSNANGQTQVTIIDPTGATTTVAMPNAPLPVQ
jgi:curli production assembly/transport component CsgF